MWGGSHTELHPGHAMRCPSGSSSPKTRVGNPPPASLRPAGCGVDQKYFVKYTLTERGEDGNRTRYLEDMVSSLSPCSTPSQVWMVLLDLTGMVPSPDSILVLSWPRAFRLGCLSPWSEQHGKKERKKRESHGLVGHFWILMNVRTSQKEVNTG
ncbi:hypothetical protein EYF80_036889 [Liparis tanakae]|uniref:Uncharacterized protein n=1 Tax=Liparis tanakae TaxID=230148 RepID=A0A4Z2GHE9_9TELE|nr:hypothetical protein EYF80_036889 [Liparis tanakae]